MNWKASRGFTLVEVMVALIIAAVLLPTLLMAYGSQADGIGYLRDGNIFCLQHTNFAPGL